MELSIVELRRLLFDVENQDMTVNELRRKLFNINSPDYDEKLSPDEWKNVMRKGGI